MGHRSALHWRFTRQPARECRPDALGVPGDAGRPLPRLGVLQHRAQVGRWAGSQRQPQVSDGGESVEDVPHGEVGRVEADLEAVVDFVPGEGGGDAGERAGAG